jgi:hypothetical protein
LQIIGLVLFREPYKHFILHVRHDSSIPPLHLGNGVTLEVFAGGDEG